MKILQLTIFCLTAYAASCSAAMLCKNEQPICIRGGNGTCVVNAVIDILETIHIFNDSDNRFLRRLAHVATKDGTVYKSIEEMLDHGGIWNFYEEKLHLMRKARFLRSIGSKMNETNSRIEKYFGIDILKDFDKDRAVKPLYCALATRLYLHYLKLVERICCFPSALDLRGQAELWMDHFYAAVGNQDCLANYFVDEVEQLEEKKDWSINADIIFVLDLSGSVRKQDFAKMKKFQKDFVNGMSIGVEHNQVGIITFKQDAKTHFNLNNYTNKSALLEEIDKMEHNEAGMTNIEDALCLLRDAYNESKGGRRPTTAVFRIAIIMTDGRSNRHHSQCNWVDTGEAAREVVQILSPLELYVIGIGATEQLNETELKAIASPDCYTHIDSFDMLPDLQARYMEQISHRVSARIKTKDVINGIIGLNGIYRYNLEIESALRVNICVSAGSHVEVFASTYIASPNSAFSEYTIDVDNEHYSDDNMTEVCHSALINVRFLSSAESDGLHKRSTTDRTIVYFSVVGKSTSNNFTVLMSDTYIDEEFVFEDGTGRAKEDNKVTLVVSISCSILFIAVSILITVTVSCAIIHSRKKKEKIDSGDQYKLLPQDSEE